MKRKRNIDAFIHFAIDDCIDSFQWLHDNEPESIFDAPMLNVLQEWHEKYLLSFDLYVFGKKGDFRLADLQDRYWEELRDNSWWLRLGWHQVEPGEIRTGEDEQIASAKRVHELVVRKCMDRGWSRVLRLHCFAGNARLIDVLHETGVRTFLTADAKGRLSYDLAEEECDKVNKYGSYRREGEEINYRLTDVRLDALSEDMAVDDALAWAEAGYNLKPWRRYLEVFCHEWRFMEIYQEIENFFEKLTTVPKKLYLNTAVVVNGALYFTVTNANDLYRMTRRTCHIESVADLPVSVGNMKFSSLTACGHSLWMVPWYETRVLFYDLQNREVCSLELPYETGSNNNQHRKAIFYGQYLWLLPTKQRTLVRIDMQACSIAMYDQFPKGVSFDDEKIMMFKNMDICGEWIYLFSDACSHNLRIHAETGEMEIWNDDFRGDFGIMLDENTVLLSPTHDGDALRFYDCASRTFEKKRLPENVWHYMEDYPEWYAFWYARRIGNHVYIVPHKANAIIRVDCRDRSIKLIRPPAYDYDTLRPNEGFSGYDVLAVGDEVWITAYTGSQILRINAEGEVVGTIDVTVPLAELVTRERLKPMLYREDNPVSMEEFLERLQYPKMTEGHFTNIEERTA